MACALRRYGVTDSGLPNPCTFIQTSATLALANHSTSNSTAHESDA
ncbi:MAG: hypothetical protein P8X89_15555 [Reinekea sp.]